MAESAGETRSEILRELKMRGGATPAELARHLGISREAVRQQLALLRERGWVGDRPRTAGGRGRPERVFRLTPAAEEQFPKFYDALTVTLIRTLGEKYGAEGLRVVLAEITDRQVDHWQEALRGKALRERIDALRGIYFDRDPFTEVQSDEEGAMLIEHNCPYLTAAQDEPRLCSVTVSTMKRLLGVEVERTERFQHGDGRCVFRIRADQAVPDDFRFGWEKSEVDE